MESLILENIFFAFENITYFHFLISVNLVIIKEAIEDSGYRKQDVTGCRL